MSWKAHVAKWKTCEACSLCETRRNTVLARGKIPCDILIIGEAPGISEDALGKPFVGPAGKLFDSFLEEALAVCDKEVRLAWTNLVACIPVEDEKREPKKNEIKACSNRLAEFVSMAAPSGIIRVGRLAVKHAKIPEGVFYTDVVHPAFLLRSQEPQYSLGCEQTVVRIRTLALDLGFAS